MFDILGLGIAAVGVGMKIFGGFGEDEASQELLAAQQKAEAIRRAQAHADAQRQRLEAIRKGIILNSQALASTTAQGAGSSQGSSKGGAYGQVSQETSWRVQGVNQALNYADQSSAANQNILAAKKDLADAQAWSSWGSSAFSLGAGIATNSQAIGNTWGTIGQDQGVANYKYLNSQNNSYMVG